MDREYYTWTIDKIHSELKNRYIEVKNGAKKKEMIRLLKSDDKCGMYYSWKRSSLIRELNERNIGANIDSSTKKEEMVMRIMDDDRYRSDSDSESDSESDSDSDSDSECDSEDECDEYDTNEIN